MPSKSTYLANTVLDLLLGGSAFSAPTTLYAALFTAMPSASGGGTEVSGTGYARAAVANTPANWPAAAAGAKSNGTAISFGTSGGSWGVVVGMALYDAATGGNLLYFLTLTIPVTISANEAVQIPAGSFVVRET